MFGNDPGWFPISLLGVLLAVSMVTAAMISVDVAVENAFLDAINDTRLDLAVWSPDLEPIPDLSQEILANQAVEWTAPLDILGYRTYLHFKKEGHAFTCDIALAVGDDFDVTGPLIGIHYDQTFDLGPREVLFADTMMDWIGDVLGRIPQEGEEINITFHGSGYGPGSSLSSMFILRGTYRLDDTSFREALGYNQRPAMILARTTGRQIIQQLGLDTEEATPNEETFPGNSGGPELGGEPNRADEADQPARHSQMPTTASCQLVGLDRSSFLDTSSFSATLLNLESIAQGFGETGNIPIAFYTPLEAAAKRHEQVLEKNRDTYLAASLPVILLGIYLGMIGMDLAHSERRREIGLLRCRGASSQQVRDMLVTESIALGCLAGIAGVLVGLLLASSLIYPPFAELSRFGLRVPSIPWLVIGVIMGIGMVLASAIRSLHRLGKEKTVDLLSGYSEAAQMEEYKPRMDLLLVLVPLSIYVAILLGPEGFVWHSAGPLLRSTAWILFTIGELLLPFTPIMMAIGLSRLLTKGTHRPYSALCSLLARPTGGLGHLAGANLARKERRAASLAVLVALSLSLGSFVLILASSQELSRQRETAFNIGGDIRIELSERTANSTLAKIGAMDGVEAVSLIQTYWDPWLHNYYILIDPATLRNCLKDNPLMDPDTENALKQMEESEDSAIAQRGTMRALGLVEGGYHIVSIEGEPAATVTVVGRFTSLPGVPATIKEATYRKLVVLHREIARNMSRVWPIGSRSEFWCILRMGKDADADQLAESIRRLDPALEEGVQVRQESGGSGFLERFTGIEFAFCAIIASMGVGLVASQNARDRRHEIGQQIARGLSRRQLVSLLLVEGLVISIIGVSVGTLAGVLPSYLYQATSAKVDGLTIPITIRIPSSIFLLPILSLGAIGAIGIIVALHASRVRPTGVLRTRL